MAGATRLATPVYSAAMSTIQPQATQPSSQSASQPNPDVGPPRETSDVGDRGKKRTSGDVPTPRPSSQVAIGDVTRDLTPFEQRENNPHEHRAGQSSSGPTIDPRGPLLTPNYRLLDEERLARVAERTVDSTRQSMSEMRELLARTEGLVTLLTAGGDAASLLSRVQSLLSGAPTQAHVPPPARSLPGDDTSTDDVPRQCQRTLSACDDARQDLDRRGPDAAVLHGRIATERASSVLSCIEDLGRNLVALEERLSSSSLITTDLNTLHYLDELRSVKRQLEEVATAMRDLRRLGEDRSNGSAHVYSSVGA